MSNVLIINAHEPSPFSSGKLNATLVDKAATLLQGKGHEVRIVTMQQEHVVDEQLANFQWADRVILQSPINWMTIPWSFKNTWMRCSLRVWGEHYVLLMVVLLKILRKTTVLAVLVLRLNTCFLSHSMLQKSHSTMKMNTYSKAKA